MTEPMTMATDYVLAILSIGLAIRLCLITKANRQKSVGLWAAAFLATAVSAGLGGTYHGLGNHIGNDAQANLWQATTYVIGLISFSMLAAAIVASVPRPLQFWLLGFAAVKLVVYVAWMTTHQDFRYVIYDYAPSMVGVLLLQGWVAYRWHEKGAGWIIGGILVSFIAAFVQQSDINIHEHFNHNDLYHLIQMGAMWLLYRGGRSFKDR